MRATAKDLRFQSKMLLDSVIRGEDVIITFRGKPCAKLVAYQDQKRKVGKNELFGMWKDKEATKNVEEYVRNMRRGRF